MTTNFQFSFKEDANSFPGRKNKVDIRAGTRADHVSIAAPVYGNATSASIRPQGSIPVGNQQVVNFEPASAPPSHTGTNANRAQQFGTLHHESVSQADGKMLSSSHLEEVRSFFQR